MLPDFPTIKTMCTEVINQYLEDLIHQEPLLSQIKRIRHFEGNRISSKTASGLVDESDYKNISSGFQINIEDVIKKGPMAFIENFQSVAEEMKKQQSQHLLKKIAEVTDKTGHVVGGRGKPFTHDTFMESLEIIDMDFDDNGEPHLPVFIVHPDLGAKLKTMLPEWKANPEYTKRYDELIERKRKEWRDRESHRKLVD